MAGVPTGPRAIPTGPRATLNAANGSNGPVYAQAPVPAAAAAAVATAVAPPAIAVRAPVAQVVPTGPAAPPLSTPAPLAAAAAGGTSSPAKRPLEDDRSVRHVSVDRTATTGGSSAGERLSMRNEPLSKRHRADSPAAAAAGAGSLAIKREQSPMLHKLPDNKPSPSQNATLGWFVGLLPPAGMFDGACGARLHGRPFPAGHSTDSCPIPPCPTSLDDRPHLSRRRSDGRHRRQPDRPDCPPTPDCPPPCTRTARHACSRWRRRLSVRRASASGAPTDGLPAAAAAAAAALWRTSPPTAADVVRRRSTASRWLAAGMIESGRRRSSCSLKPCVCLSCDPGLCEGDRVVGRGSA